MSALALFGTKPIALNTSANLCCQHQPKDLRPYKALSTINVFPSSKPNSGPSLIYTSPLSSLQDKHCQCRRPIALENSTRPRKQPTIYHVRKQCLSIRSLYLDLSSICPHLTVQPNVTCLNPLKRNVVQGRDSEIKVKARL
jgi:hypothetical protein